MMFIVFIKSEMCFFPPHLTARLELIWKEFECFPSMLSFAHSLSLSVGMFSLSPVLQHREKHCTIAFVDVPRLSVRTVFEAHPPIHTCGKGWHKAGKAATSHNTGHRSKAELPYSLLSWTGLISDFYLRRRETDEIMNNLQLALGEVREAWIGPLFCICSSHNSTGSTERVPTV